MASRMEMKRATLAKFIRKHARNGLALAIFVSMILHIAVLVPKFNFLDYAKRIAKSAPRKIKIVLMDRKERKKFFKKKDKKKKQVVNNELKGRIERPKDSRFLGEKNQKYDRQTVASKIDIFKKAGHGERDGSKSPKVAPKLKKVVSKRKPTKRGKKRVTLADLSFAQNYAPKMRPVKKMPTLKDLGIKSGELGKRGLAQNNDYIEDLPLGDMTNLNTVEFKYYGFYHRIRQKLEQYWGDSLRQKADKLFRSGRRIASNSDKMTSLAVTIDSKGNILNVHVKGTSGIRELDDAAVESFTRAGPFPNPPSGMIKNGRVTIEWGFVVKV